MKLRNNLKASLILKILWVVIAIVGTILSFVMPNLAKDNTVRSPFLFYTNWSVYFSLIVGITSLISIILQLIKKKESGNNELVPILKFSANIMIIATFIVSAFVLPDKIWKAEYWTLPSIFKHFLLPIITVLDAVLFDRKRSYRWSYPLIALIFPLIYWIALIIRIVVNGGGSTGIPENMWDHYYPYGFTNLDKEGSMGLGGLIGLLAGIMVGLILIGYIFFVFDKLEKIDGKSKFNFKVDEENMTDIFALIKRKK